MKPHDFAIAVTARWNDWRLAHARLGDLSEVHWHRPQGAPHALVHAYASCADLVGGELCHNCDASSAPHRIRVCVLKKHNVPTAYAELARKADDGLDAHQRRTRASRSAILAPMCAW